MAQEGREVTAGPKSHHLLGMAWYGKPEDQAALADTQEVIVVLTLTAGLSTL
jgi:hypothetical protein